MNNDAHYLRASASASKYAKGKGSGTFCMEKCPQKNYAISTHILTLQLYV